SVCGEGRARSSRERRGFEAAGCRIQPRLAGCDAHARAIGARGGICSRRSRAGLTCRRGEACSTRRSNPEPWAKLWIARLAARNDGWLTIESELIFVVSGLEP